MALKLMYITNKPEVARIAAAAGTDRIFVDMEYIGKADRQGGMDTVQSHHTVEDIRRIREAVPDTELLVRINPIHEASAEYGSSKEEIDAAIEAGADILMLPYFKTAEEVRSFLEMTGGRVRTMPLLETPEAAEAVNDILDLPGLDTLYIGLNDLSLGLGRKFMFEPLAEGMIEALSKNILAKGIPFGFGGIAAPGGGTLPAEYILGEHHRLGSTCVILSRSFCNTDQIQDLQKVDRIFRTGIQAIRDVEVQWAAASSEELEENRRRLVSIVEEIARQKQS